MGAIPKPCVGGSNPPGGAVVQHPYRALDLLATEQPVAVKGLEVVQNEGAEGLRHRMRIEERVPDDVDALKEPCARTEQALLGIDLSQIEVRRLPSEDAVNRCSSTTRTSHAEDAFATPDLADTATGSASGDRSLRPTSHSTVRGSGSSGSAARPLGPSQQPRCPH